MNTPPFLLGAAILFWGWLGAHPAIALALAAAFELARFIGWRVRLAEDAQKRLTDATTLLALVAGVGFYLAAGFPRAAILFFEWLPVILLPAALMQAYGSEREIDLRVLFWSLRRRAPREPKAVNLGYPYLIAWVIAASATPSRGPEFDLGLAVLIAWALWPLRPGARRIARWLCLMAAAMAIGYVAGIGLHDLQLWLEGAAPEWIAGGGTKVNAYRGTTDIGRLGELKMSDAIALRVRPEFELKPPLLLHQASYNDYVGVNWIARGGTFSKLPPEAGGRSWRLGAGANSLVLVVDEQARHGDPVLALPLGAVAILDVDARALKRNPLGAVQIEASAGFIAYRVSFDPGIAERHSPGAAELTIPPAERATIERIAREWGLAGLSAQNAVDAIRARLFADFTYSTFQKAAAGSATPLADFLLRTRSGHCEHFASATTLLLRAVGVPARYASGYSIQEWSDLEGAWIARERHSHAWTRAFVDGKWIDVDSTPPIWLELENRERPAWAKLADAWSWVRYRIERWFEATGAAERSLALGLPIGLLLLGLAWRALRALRAAALRPAPAATPVPATDASGSEFTLVERHLAALGAPREPAETVREWMARIAARIPGDAAELARLAALHYRLRFDPAGLARGEREDLARGAARWISSTPTG